jgi:hypothetical protein
MNKDEKKCECKPHFHHCKPAGNDALYGLGVVGALFYFLKGATSFMMVITGIGKAVFWPAVVLFKLLTLLKI